MPGSKLIMIGVVISQMVSISYAAVSLPSLCVKESSLDLMLVHLVNIKSSFICLSVHTSVLKREHAHQRNVKLKLLYIPSAF